jgi:epoxyqueuosine reductase
MMDLEGLTTAIKTEANRLGFNHIGIAPAFPVPHYDEFIRWVEAGCHGDMGYLARPDTLAKRGNPQEILEGCQRIISLAMPYRRPQNPLGDCPPGMGRISNYALTQDYHDLIWKKLDQLENFIHREVGEAVKTRSYVDTGPILERSYASSAGLGSAGKNSCLIIKGYGTYFFLAEILTDLPLPIDEPFTQDLCGSCTRCIDACPTGCIRDDHTINAEHCISYLTIEKKGKIPDDLKPLIGEWVFGCDVCQIVCPHNAWTPEQEYPLGEPHLPEYLDLMALFSLSKEEFNQKFDGTPILRTKRTGMLRNAAIVLGNQGYQPALAVLKRAINQEKDEAVRDACTWAIHQIEAKL